MPPVMTNTQLYLAIGIPVAFNFGIMLTFFILLNGNINTRISDLRAHMDSRFTSADQLFQERLRRVEEVVDARLSRIEQELS